MPTYCRQTSVFSNAESQQSDNYGSGTDRQLVEWSDKDQALWKRKLTLSLFVKPNLKVTKLYKFDLLLSSIPAENLPSCGIAFTKLYKVDSTIGRKERSYYW